MALPQNPGPSHLYSQELQLKLYQAFIFSIPILFSIILFLLFYLFYLKRRAFTLSSPPPILPMTSNHASSFSPSTSEMDLKGELKDKLSVVLFDEDLRAKDSQCCVCLGEFEMEEELQQVPSCKHVFHANCISHWIHLYSNSTCPLCRASIDITPPTSSKLGLDHIPQPPPPLPDHLQQHQQQPPPPPPPPPQSSFDSISFTNHSREQA